ncbi:NUDIX hydrolase [archaeon]|nr:NUDIX hydrolase [archaeon]
MNDEQESKMKELDLQLSNILEEKLSLARSMSKNGMIEDNDFSTKLEGKATTLILNSIFKEFDKRIAKLNIKSIVATGPVIIQDGKLLVNKDGKDDFYKIPGGSVAPGTEDLEESCYREAREENNANIEIIKPLHPMIIWKNPQTEEKMAILLIHYLAKLKNPDEIKPIAPTKEVIWLDIEEIKQGKHNVAPNIKFLIEKGDIK